MLRPRQLYAQLLEKTGRLELAWQEVERAAQVDPSFQLPLFSLADSKSRAGRHCEALEVIEKMAETGIGPRSRAFVRAICLIRAGKFVDVIPLLMEAHKAGYEPGSYACVLAWFYSRFSSVSKEAEKQRRHWEKVVRHHGLPMESVLADKIQERVGAAKK